MDVLVDGGGGGGSSHTDYESFNGPKVTVDINGLVDFFEAMNRLQQDAAGPTTNELMPMTLMIRESLATPEVIEVGPFPEGVAAARLMTHRQSDFQRFLQDVLQGVGSIASAAAVVAELYENGDSENASGLDVAFAFADPSATAPSGFRSYETRSEIQRRQREESGGYAMSATGDDSQARVVHVARGVTVYYYPDGSSKQVVTTTRPGGSPHQSRVRVTETTIYDSDREEIQTTVVESSTVHGGGQLENTTVTQADGSSSRTSTTASPDGTITVTSQTTTADGETSDPTTVTVEPGDHNSDTSDAGPIERAEDQLDSYGDRETEEAYGRGY